jgi:hypothetical protein
MPALLNFPNGTLFNRVNLCHFEPEQLPFAKSKKSHTKKAIVPKFSWIYLHGCLFLPMDFKNGINYKC